MSRALRGRRVRIRIQAPASAPPGLLPQLRSWDEKGVAWASLTLAARGESPARYDVSVRRTPIEIGWRIVTPLKALRVIGVADAENGSGLLVLSCVEESQ